MTWRTIHCWKDEFDRAQTYSTTPGHQGWTIADTSSSGTPTYLNGSDGAVLTLANTSEAENVCLYQNDILPFNINNIQHIEFLAKVSGIDAVTTLTMGLGSARNDTPDSVATNCWFRMEGSASTSNVVVETDDGTTDNNDVATSTTLAGTFKRFTIDFENGLSDIRFYIDGARVAEGTTFSMVAASSTQHVQPIFQVQKASGTGTPAVTIRCLKVQYTRSV